MRLPRILLVVIYLLRCHIARSIAAPTRATNPALLAEVASTMFQDDVTTQEPFLKKCIVDGNAYSHSQTIPSYDTNSHCLCVVGEVYCWWQNYNPTSAPSLGLPSLRSTAMESNYTSPLEMSTDIVDDFEASGDSDSSIGQQGHIKINATLSITSPAPITCLVMGREYRQGETLPHSTGNCIECSCGSEGRVECSPRDCVALRPEILVAPDISGEAADSDFEVFNLARDRGIDESF
ncbi:uncharacterized protein [Anoplolepis gracilipes]|uniref:uncharacterized protein n=1 Tax=Anoplolepis gracilipes TaxID=354296 RepID=UPI003BA0007D